MLKIQFTKEEMLSIIIACKFLKEIAREDFNESVHTDAVDWNEVAINANQMNLIVQTINRLHILEPEVLTPNDYDVIKKAISHYSNIGISQCDYNATLFDVVGVASKITLWEQAVKNTPPTILNSTEIQYAKR